MEKTNKMPLIELAEVIADNKYILGDRLVEVGVSGPNLEATLSSIAMAQQELGHSRLIYRWAFDLRGVDGRVDIEDQTGKAFHHIVKISNWIELIAGLYVTNTSADLVMRAMIEADHPKINPPFKKMLKEQREHLIYANSWCKQLLNDKGSIPRRFREALELAAHEASEWLQQIENNSYFISENIIPQHSKLMQHFKKDVEDILKVGAVTNVV